MTQTSFIRFLLPALLVAGPSSCRNDRDEIAADPNNPTESFFVFVDNVHGSASGTGTRLDPLSDIPAGIALAKAQRKAVCIAEGTYDRDSNSDGPLAVDGAVSLYGGYRNTAGIWIRDPELYPTKLVDKATTGGGTTTPLSAVSCSYGAGAGVPVLDGFVLQGAASGTNGTCLLVSNDSSVTVMNCEFKIGGTDQACGVHALHNIVRDAGTITLRRCSLSGGGGTTVYGLSVYRYNLTLSEVEISGLSASNRAWGVDVGYSAFTADACSIDPAVSTGIPDTCGLYINECAPFTVTRSTLRGGNGANQCRAMDIMDTEAAGGPCRIEGNLIDGGSGNVSIGIRLGWAEIFPSIVGNAFTGSGTSERYGIYEADNTADPVLVANNSFHTALADPSNTRYLYRDYTGNTQHRIGDAATLNAIDEAPYNYNPPGSVYGNTVSP